jgi:hypothetical protein
MTKCHSHRLDRYDKSVRPVWQTGQTSWCNQQAILRILEDRSLESKFRSRWRAILWSVASNMNLSSLCITYKNVMTMFFSTVDQTGQTGLSNEQAILRILEGQSLESKFRSRWRAILWSAASNMNLSSFCITYKNVMTMFFSTVDQIFSIHSMISDAWLFLYSLNLKHAS